VGRGHPGPSAVPSRSQGCRHHGRRRRDARGGHHSADGASGPGLQTSAPVPMEPTPHISVENTKNSLAKILPFGGYAIESATFAGTLGLHMRLRSKSGANSAKPYGLTSRHVVFRDDEDQDYRWKEGMPQRPVLCGEKKCVKNAAKDFQEIAENTRLKTKDILPTASKRRIIAL
jgi:hypothetical protein